MWGGTYLCSASSESLRSLRPLLAVSYELEELEYISPLGICSTLTTRRSSLCFFMASNR